VIVPRNDGRTAPHIAWPEVSGFTACFAFPPKPFNNERDYFRLRK
jgi:hypothetical protein